MFVEALVRLLVAEHKVRPIRGKILALGKQTIALPLSKIIEIFHEHGCSINPNFNPDKAQKDATTRARNEDSIDDREFFQLFGDIDYQTMDVSSYENASIIHDLNQPIDKSLEGQFDFIVDGGTFDHLFDIKTAFANVVRLLKTGGRIFQWNAASNYANSGYVSFGADFFHDYYTLNKFSDCRTYFAEAYHAGAQNWRIYQFVPPQNNERYVGFRRSPFYTMVLVFATKGADSTYNRMPIQLQYRDEALREEYRNTMEKFASYGKGPAVKTIRMRATKMPGRHKILHSIYYLKPDAKVYQEIGWL